MAAGMNTHFLVENSRPTHDTLKGFNRVTQRHSLFFTNKQPRISPLRWQRSDYVHRQ